MSTTAYEQTSVLVSARAVPNRVLVVDDEEGTLADIATALTGPDLEVIRAGSSAEAITLVARQWIPVVVTDDQMPEMDGIALVHRVRALAAKPTYVIMLSSTADSAELERGYCAGVDHFVAKRNWPATLPTKVADGLKAIRLRRIGKRRLAHESVVTVDLQSGAHTARHLVGRLSAEINLSRRQHSNVSVVMLGVHPLAGGEQQALTDAQLISILAAFKGALRPQLDWVAWLHNVGSAHRFAAILPSALTEAAAFVQSVRNAFVAETASIGSQIPALTFGTASFDASQTTVPTALELIARAEGARRAAEPTAAHTAQAPLKTDLG